MISVLAGLVTFCTRVDTRPGHRHLGSSTTAIIWTHWAAALGLKLSVPSAPNTFCLVASLTSSGMASHLSSYWDRRFSSLV